MYLQTGVYLSVERSNTVTRPSPDTVANTVLVQLEVIAISINMLIILLPIIIINFTQQMFTLNKEPTRCHQHKSRGQIYDSFLVLLGWGGGEVP